MNSIMKGVDFVHTVLFAAVRMAVAILVILVPKFPPHTLDEVSLAPVALEAPGTKRQSKPFEDFFPDEPYPQHTDPRLAPPPIVTAPEIWKSVMVAAK